MDRINRKSRLTALLFIAWFAATGAAQTSSFTYQGRLTDGGTPANGPGPYQMQFTLFPSAEGGDPLGPPIQIDLVDVANGVFTVELNFTAPNAFNGGARWLEIAVKKPTDHLFSLLTPRQPITSTLTWTGKTERLGIVFNTPSHHRVHHAVNQQYLDKNFSDFLIIWDKLFGTFEPEHEQVVYGMYNPPRSWNPLKINFHYFGVIWRDAIATKSWLDKVRVWFMPSGWRPGDLPPFDHQEITEQNQVRYRSQMFASARAYLILQAVTAIPFTVMIISEESALTTAARWLGGALLWMQIVNWGGILEARRWAWISEIVRLVLTLSYLLWIFPRNQFAGVLVVAFAAGSMIWTAIYFRPRSGSTVLKARLS